MSSSWTHKPMNDGVLTLRSSYTILPISMPAFKPGEQVLIPDSMDDDL